MKPFNYESAATLQEAISEGGGTTRFLAGGTDLLTLMKADIVTPERLLDIKRLPDLPAGIEETAAGVTLGALTTLTEIEMHPLIKAQYPALAEAAALAATPQLRNMATLGGNLLQRPRCWYYRSHHFHCWLQGGEKCHAKDGENELHALFGDSPCVAVHPSDLAPALMALGASVLLRGQAGERTLALESFFAQPNEARRTETVLHEGEMILSLTLPKAQNSHSTYLKAMDRKVWSFALVGVAVNLSLENQRVTDARIVLSGVAPIPWRVPEAEAELKGNTVDEALAERVADLALAGAEALEHNAYKIPLARNLVKQALLTLSGKS